MEAVVAISNSVDALTASSIQLCHCSTFLNTAFNLTHLTPELPTIAIVLSDCALTNRVVVAAANTSGNNMFVLGEEARRTINRLSEMRVYSKA